MKQKLRFGKVEQVGVIEFFVAYTLFLKLFRVAFDSSHIVNSFVSLC